MEKRLISGRIREVLGKYGYSRVRFGKITIIAITLFIIKIVIKYLKNVDH
jgi:hypothetical protein